MFLAVTSYNSWPTRLLSQGRISRSIRFYLWKAVFKQRTPSFSLLLTTELIAYHRRSKSAGPNCSMRWLQNPGTKKALSINKEQLRYILGYLLYLTGQQEDSVGPDTWPHLDRTSTEENWWECVTAICVHRDEKSEHMFSKTELKQACVLIVPAQANSVV